MGAIEREHHLRKQVGGLALMAAPVLALIGVALTPTLESDEEQWLANLADGMNRAWAGHIVGVVSLGVMAFAVFALVHILREREPLFADIGGGVALFGIVLSAIYTGMVGMTMTLNDSLVSTRYAAEILHDAATNPIAITGLVGLAVFGVGMLVLAVGLYRAAVIPTLLALGIAVATIGMVAGYTLASTPMLIAAFIVGTAAMAPIGWTVLREADDAWEHTPLVRGFGLHAT